jgi:4-hydroxybenzoate polyprenyltransferase
MRKLLETVKFSHSLFALPFALCALWVAANGFPAPRIFFWVVWCMVTARCAALAFNRWADRDFDAKNPRTAARHSVTGAVSPRFLILFTATCATLLCFGAAMLNVVCLALALPALTMLLGYSYAKRFTAFSHLWLGGALGLAPLGAFLAVRGDGATAANLTTASLVELLFQPFPLLLGAAVALWTAGFDVVYACQDIHVDRADPRLHSLPKTLGIKKALRAAAASHFCALLLFALAGIHAHLRAAWFGALLLVAVLLTTQHLWLKSDVTGRAERTFFFFNGPVGILFFTAVLIEFHGHF